MALGSYFKGATVKIPANITIDGIPEATIVPIIERIVLPNGSMDSGFPVTMTRSHTGSATYFYNYIPQYIGDYIVIIKTEYEGAIYNTIEYFTVADATIKYIARNPPRIVAS